MVLAVDMVRRGAERFADRTAVRFGDDVLTFRQTYEAASRLANSLLRRGIGQGDRVALLVGNGLWSVSLDFACLEAGIVRVPLNARLSVNEHERMLVETDARWLVHAPELEETATMLCTRVPGLFAIGLGGPGASDGSDLLADAAGAPSSDPHLDISANDRVLLLYTSGTTGTLKAVTHTQATYGAIATNILTNLLDPSRESVMLHAASLIHASGTFVLPYWLRGATTAILPRFEPQEFLDAIARYHVTEVNLVPTMLGMLFASGAVEDADVSSLRTVIYGASPMPRPVLDQAMAAWGPIFAQYYGQTEAPLCISVLDQADHLDEELLGSCGYPAVDAEVRLGTEEGEPVGPGEIGEIQVRAPFVTTGYHRAAELNAEMWTADGWLRTRDMARRDQRGYLYLVDRRSDMIVTGGYNVYPREVEDALLAHPAVAECAVVGAPDPVWVEAVTAFVALKPGAQVDAAELQATVRRQLASYKVPKQVEFVPTIPKSSVGKVLRRALRDPLWADR
ncbi:MAG: AMP-binding protein [Actinomycetota bacterium]|nr:AMP-binding protein [Actinomycetota bacterium]